MATRYQKFIGGLLGEDVEGMSEEERKRLAREGTLKTVMGFLGGRGLLGGITEYKQEREGARRKAAAENLMGTLFAPQAGSAQAPQVAAPQPAAGAQPASAAPASAPSSAGALPVPPVAGAPETPNAPRLPGPPQGMDFQSMARIMLTTQAGRDLAQMNPELFKYVMENAKPNEEKITNDYSDYLRAKNQGYSGSFIDYQKELKRAGASNVTVPVDLGQKANVKAQEAIATADASALQDLRKSAEASRTVWRGAQKIIDLSSRPGYSGVLAPNMIGANNFLVSIFGKGVAPEALANSEAFGAAVNNLVFAEMATLGGARGFSREETAMLLDAFPKITSSPQARIMIAKMLQNKAIENMNYYNDSLSNFKSTYTDVRTSMRPIEVPGSSAPPAGTTATTPLRRGR